jgi:RNA polymerase sigma-70 factor, ECF subfamily
MLPLPHPSPTPNASFAECFAANVGYVAKTLRRLGVATRDVEDQVHDLFLEVHRKWGTFDPSRPARPLLFGYALRVASTYRRSARVRHERAVASDAKSLEWAAAPDSSSRRDDAELVYAALSRLDDERRAVFVMFELDAFSLQEIAELLSIAQSTVVSRLRLGREDFKRAVLMLTRPPTTLPSDSQASDNLHRHRSHL